MAEWYSVRLESGRPEFKPRFPRGAFFPRSSHTGGLRLGSPLAALSSAWRYRDSDGTESVYCDWARKLDLQLLSQCGSMHNGLSLSIPGIHTHTHTHTHPWDTLACRWGVKQATNSKPLQHVRITERHVGCLASITVNHLHGLALCLTQVQYTDTGLTSASNPRRPGREAIKVANVAVTGVRGHGKARCERIGESQV